MSGQVVCHQKFTIEEDCTCWDSRGGISCFKTSRGWTCNCLPLSFTWPFIFPCLYMLPSKWGWCEKLGGKDSYELIWSMQQWVSAELSKVYEIEQLDQMWPIVVDFVGCSSSDVASVCGVVGVVQHWWNWCGVISSYSCTLQTLCSCWNHVDNCLAFELGTSWPYMSILRIPFGCLCIQLCPLGTQGQQFCCCY